MKTGIAEDDFQHALGGGIFPKDGIDLLSDDPKHSAFLIGCRPNMDAAPRRDDSD
jgi:hypothetical protein